MADHCLKVVSRGVQGSVPGNSIPCRISRLSLNFFPRTAAPLCLVPLDGHGVTDDRLAHPSPRRVPFRNPLATVETCVEYANPPYCTETAGGPCSSFHVWQLSCLANNYFDNTEKGPRRECPPYQERGDVICKAPSSFEVNRNRSPAL